MRKQALDHFNAEGSEVCVKSLIIKGLNIPSGVDCIIIVKSKIHFDMIKLFWYNSDLLK